eukprot:2862094-Pleurochrysis_carterae.AAC.1
MRLRTFTCVTERARGIGSRTEHAARRRWRKLGSACSDERRYMKTALPTTESHAPGGDGMR